MLARLAKIARALGSTPVKPTPSANLTDEMPIIVPQSAVEAFPEKAWPLIGAVVDHVNVLTHTGRFNRLEIAALAMQCYHADYWLAQVNNGGHSQFIHNTGENMGFTLADIRTCLDGIDNEVAEDYQIIVTALSRWLEDNPAEAAAQTGFEGGRAAALDELDDMFYALEADGSLQEMLAERVLAAPNLMVVPDAKLSEARERLCMANPHRADRDRIFTIAGLDAQLSDPFKAMVAVAVGKLRPTVALIALGNGAYRQVGQAQQMCFTIQTTAGKLWAVLHDDRVDLHSYVEHDNPDMPENPFDASMEQISKWKAPEVGALEASADRTEAATVASLVKELKAGASLDLMLSQQLQPPKIDRITVRSAGPDAAGMPGLSLLLVLNGAKQAATALITPEEAALLREPDRSLMGRFTRDQIEAHAQLYSVESLLTGG